MSGRRTRPTWQGILAATRALVARGRRQSLKVYEKIKVAGLEDRWIAVVEKGFKISFESTKSPCVIRSGRCPARAHQCGHQKPRPSIDPDSVTRFVLPVGEGFLGVDRHVQVSSNHASLSGHHGGRKQPTDQLMNHATMTTLTKTIHNGPIDRVMNHARMASLAPIGTHRPNCSIDEPCTYGATHVLTNHSELIS